MADIDNCDGSNFLRRACDAGTGGGGGGGSEFNASLTNGDGIGILDYDGSVAKTITVNSSVVRNTTDQVIAGGLTIEKLTSNGPITGQGLDISGIFSVGGDGSIGGSSPAATNVIAWNGAKWAPATAGGAASSSNLDLGYALNQSLRTSDEGQLSKLDVTGVTGLLSSGHVGIGTSTPSGAIHVIGSSYLEKLYITGVGGSWLNLGPTGSMASKTSSDYVLGTSTGSMASKTASNYVLGSSTGSMASKTATDYVLGTSTGSMASKTASNYVLGSSTGCAATKTCEYFTGKVFGYTTGAGQTLDDGNIIRWSASEGGWIYAPSGAGSSNLDGGWILNQSLQTTDAGQLKTLKLLGSSSAENGEQFRISQSSVTNKQFNFGYHTGNSTTQNVDYGKIEVYNASEPGGAKYMPLSLQSAGGSVVIGSTISKGLLGVSGDTYSQRVFLTGAGGSWGQLGGETLSQGDGISAFSFDALGAGALTVGVDSSVLRTGDIEQTIHGDRTFTGTITIGNLNVTGSQNIVTTNQLVSNGPTFTLNTGVGGGVNSYDIGWVGQRGSSLNVAVLWKEDQDQFELINTDGISGGAAYPEFAVSGYEGLKVSNLKSTGKVFVKTEVAKGDLSVSGSTYSQDIYTTGVGGSWERISSINDQSTSFNTALSAGSSIYTINFPKTFGAAPVVNASLQNSAGGAIVPHMISGVGTSSYSVVFGSSLADSNYSINTSARPTSITDDGTVTQSFSTALTEGVTTQTISYPSSFGATPYVNVTIEGAGSIVPYYISGVSATNYDVVFGAPIPANNKIHTFAVR